VHSGETRETWIRKLITILERTTETLVNKPMRNPKGKSRMDITEKLAILGTQDTRGRETKPKTQHSMCWTPLCKNQKNNVNNSS
jgi:hypothetical protein